MESSGKGLRRRGNTEGEMGVADLIHALQKKWEEITDENMVARNVQKLLVEHKFEERDGKTALHLIDESSGASDGGDPLLKIMALNWVSGVWFHPFPLLSLADHSNPT